MVMEHNGTGNVEDETGTAPRTIGRSIRIDILAAALIGATIALRAPKSWRSSAGSAARSAGTSLGLRVWDMRQHIGPSLKSVGSRVGPTAQLVGSRIGWGRE